MYRTKPARYFHTLRYLKPQQFFYRLMYGLKKTKINTRTQKSVLRVWNKAFLSPEGVSSPLLNTGELCFLGEKAVLSHSNLWNDPKRSKLWLYHLHYFDGLNGVNASLNQDFLMQLIERWIDENPILLGNGWEPYPLSLRLVNWIKCFSKNPEMVQPHWKKSLVLQARALVKQLEFHILGNHLFANAKALVFIGAYLGGVEANAWLEKGLRLLEREVSEQFLLDGGHFERSPMYHAALLWDMCDLCYLISITHTPALKEKQTQWEGVIQRGLYWLDAMTHPDGDISFFNDATFGVAPKLQELREYASQLNIECLKQNAPMRLLKQTGYCVVEMNQGMKAILDVGEVGPDYQPGHAHADTLSFELSVDMQRVMVNSGISQYGQDALRHDQRSTKAHNTVCIDGMNSSDIWAGFRVGRRARPLDLVVQEKPDEIKIACSHDGYIKSSGRNIHRRSWCFSSNSMLVHDEITGCFLTAEAYFYLHPSVSIVSVDATRVVLCLPSKKEVIFYLDSEAKLRVNPSSWYPGFGQAAQNHCLVITFKDNVLITRLGW